MKWHHFSDFWRHLRASLLLREYEVIRPKPNAALTHAKQWLPRSFHTGFSLLQKSQCNTGREGHVCLWLDLWIRSLVNLAGSCLLDNMTLVKNRQHIKGVEVISYEVMFIHFFLDAERTKSSFVPNKEKSSTNKAEL